MEVVEIIGKGSSQAKVAQRLESNNTLIEQ
jgi:hypothetical protein